MTLPILVHKCFNEKINRIYFKKEDARKCHQCKHAFEAEKLNIYLQEDLVDKMNIEIFRNHQFAVEIENIPEKFFNPEKITLIVDKTLHNYKEYKTSWREKI